MLRMTSTLVPISLWPRGRLRLNSTGPFLERTGR